MVSSLCVSCCLKFVSCSIKILLISLFLYLVLSVLLSAMSGRELMQWDLFYWSSSRSKRRLRAKMDIPSNRQKNINYSIHHSCTFDDSSKILFEYVATFHIMYVICLMLLTQIVQIVRQKYIIPDMQGEKKIEKYQFSLKKLLGQGSYAMVYLGRCIQSSQPVAVKVIDKKIFSNAYNVKNIQSQIDIMKKVSHQNIVKLYDIYQTANNMYIVTQFCQDGDLHKLLQRRRKIPENEAKEYLRDIMNGAKYLHKNGIIHRDLKPANILMKSGVCKLSDFGFAKSLNSEEAVMKSIVGTPLYMSPQILKKGKYTTKSDLWSIGLIYYEMLHGRTPWPAQNEIQLINGIYNKKIVFAAEVSERSRDFIRRCLEIYEEERISWEEAFNHRLLQEEIKKGIVLELSQDKENNGNMDNKLRTPTAKRENKEEKSPLSFKSREVVHKQKKIELHCLTPKERLTPKANQDKSSFKAHKADLIDRRQKDTSTLKKRTIQQPSKLDRKCF